MKEHSKVLVAVILGAAAGAVLGMLIAPEKGSECRKKLSSFANDLVDSALELANQAKGGAEYTDENGETPLGV